MDGPLVALVLAGGIGSRLYPASRSQRPKQFLPLGDGGESLLARTVRRASFADRVFVATRESFAEEVRERVPEAEVVVEPAGKDTGPALVYATHEIRARVRTEEDGAEPVVLVLPSDHRVPEADAEAFERTLRTGARVAAERGALVAFGVEPTRPETGYGYVEPGADRGDHFELASFREKPDAETAARYVEAGYLWNAGLFAWTPEALFEEVRGTPLEPLAASLERGEPEAGFEAVDPVSIDYAVMERADRAAVVPAGFRWDDLGAWDALERVLDTDADGNAVLGEALTLDAADNVVASDGKHVSLVGVDGLAVVAWDDRVLVVPKERAQRVREVVAELEEDGLF